MSFQKLSKFGKPVIDHNGLPVHKKSVDHRLKVIREIITIGMKPDEARWWNIQYDANKLIGFNT